MTVFFPSTPNIAPTMAGDKIPSIRTLDKPEDYRTLLKEEVDDCFPCKLVGEFPSWTDIPDIPFLETANMGQAAVLSLVLGHTATSRGIPSSRSNRHASSPASP